MQSYDNYTVCANEITKNTLNHPFLLTKVK